MNARRCIRARKRRQRAQRRWDAVNSERVLTIAWQTWRRWLREGAQCDCLTREEFEAML